MQHKPEIVLITGATGDFGKAFAKRFSQIGSKLILHGRDQKKLDELIKQYPQSIGIVFDMTDKAAMKKAIEAAVPDATRKTKP